MAAISYTARRSLVAGHTAGTAYSFDVPMIVINRGARAERKTHTALSGNTATYLQRVESVWSFRTDYVDESVLLQLREFLDSCLGRSTFTLDPYGTVAVADQVRTMRLESDDYTEQRRGVAEEWAVAFKALEG